MNIPKKLLSEVKKYLSSFKEISSIFIFGSTLNKTWDNAKDLDIALLLKKGKTLNNKLLVLKTYLSDIVKKDVDIVVLNNCDPITSFEARKQGFLIMDKDPDYRAVFETNAYKEYLDQIHRDKIYYKYT